MFDTTDRSRSRVPDDWDEDSPKMPFGRYEGNRLADIPPSYLRNLFADGREWLREPLNSAIRNELIARGVPFGKFKGTPIDQLPDSYLAWLTTIDLFPPLDQFVQEEIERREREQQLQRRAAEPAPTRAKRPKTKRRSR
jgi:uncharacterized protein (DUF3820 family)